jgi:hypothetical protein
MELDLLANLCLLLQEISYQLHFHNALQEHAQGRAGSETLEDPQGLGRVYEGGEHVKVGVHVGLWR